MNDTIHKFEIMGLITIDFACPDDCTISRCIGPGNGHLELESGRIYQVTENGRKESASDPGMLMFWDKFRLIKFIKP